VRPDSIALVLLSAALHASWNLLLKRAGGSQVVVAISKAAEVVCLAPLFLAWTAWRLPGAGTVLLYTGVAAGGVLLNYVAIAGAYRHGDLSFVYPISRGAALAILPVLGFLFLGERIGAREVGGLAVIGGGILLLPLGDFGHSSGSHLRASFGSAATRYALLAALTTAFYTIWDKRAVAVMEPFAYMYLYTVLVAMAYTWWLFTRVEKEERREQWRSHRGAAVAIGLLNVGSYLLILYALRTEVSSVVIGVRQVSIAIGVALGRMLLREPVPPPRAVGAGLIVVGCLTLSV
jgi:drug/metabolite transporter (DMT)-like permease